MNRTASDGCKPSWFSRLSWRRVRRVALGLFLAAVAVLLVRLARHIQWQEVFDALRQVPFSALALAGALTLLSFTIYCTYDLFGRHLTEHPLSAASVMRVAFISYAFNLNLGALVGGVGFRFRLYARLGLSGDVIARIVAWSMLSNWSGYLLIAGLVFLLRPMPLPANWAIGIAGLRVLGALMLLLTLGYLLLCARQQGREWHWRGYPVRLPPLRLALLQIALSALNWAVMGGIVWILLQHRADYVPVLAVLLVGALAGVIAHVPASLGVLEAVFIALLGHHLARTPLLAALLAYRALYYLLPLGLATLGFLASELRARNASKAVRITQT